MLCCATHSANAQLADSSCSCSPPCAKAALVLPVLMHLFAFAFICMLHRQHALQAACTGGSAPPPSSGSPPPLSLVVSSTAHCIACTLAPARGGCSAALAFADLACAANAQHCTARGQRMLQERSRLQPSNRRLACAQRLLPTYQTPSKGYVLFKGYCQCSCQPQLEPSSSSFTCTSPSIGFLCSA